MHSTHDKDASFIQRFGDTILLYNPGFEWLVPHPILILREWCIIIGIIISGLMLGESNNVETKSAAQAALPTLLSLFTISAIAFLVDTVMIAFTFDIRREHPLNPQTWHQPGLLRRRSRFFILLQAGLYLIQIALAAACVHVLLSSTTDGRPLWLDLPRTAGGKVMFATAILSLFLTISAALLTWARLFLVRVSLTSRWALPQATAPFRPCKPATTSTQTNPSTSVLALDTIYQNQIDNKHLQQTLLQKLPVEHPALNTPTQTTPPKPKPSTSPCTANLRYWYHNRVLCATYWTIAFALTQTAVVIASAATITKITGSGSGRRAFHSCGGTCTATYAFSLAALLIWVPVTVAAITAVRLRVAFERNLLWGLTVSKIVAGGVFFALGLGVCGAALLLVMMLRVEKGGDPAVAVNGMVGEWRAVAVFGLIAESVLFFFFGIICGAFFLPEPKMRGYAKNLYLHFLVRRQEEATLYLDREALVA
ncbi:hypothetical protein QBC34DRAFT_413621 [Podospora aff. communis PSN243]|uniref:Uncharacterized protein n=1 Tax=Podospora aff. communis PSN243 TaxID=3040156 RepID=A0AAV9GAH6_9PEZI|nr:hypothetical protein QBC34DRAFT_413621 [Podospora aff. communis PSN243]